MWLCDDVHEGFNFVKGILNRLSEVSGYWIADTVTDEWALISIVSCMAFMAINVFVHESVIYYLFQHHCNPCVERPLPWQTTNLVGSLVLGRIKAHCLQRPAVSFYGQMGGLSSHVLMYCTCCCTVTACCTPGLLHKSAEYCIHVYFVYMYPLTTEHLWYIYCRLDCR